MDKCTHEVRKQYWKGIISQCMQRPEGMTAKQWLDNNGIVEQTYYSWLKKIRQETYELATTTKNLPVETTKSDLSFAEISIPHSESQTEQSSSDIYSCSKSFKPVAVIQSAAITISLSNDISEALLNRILTEVSNA